MQESAVATQGHDGATAEGTDLIRAGKEKAKAVMAASGVTLGATDWVFVRFRFGDLGSEATPHRQGRCVLGLSRCSLETCYRGGMVSQMAGLTSKQVC